MFYQKKCEYCGKIFTAQKSNTRFCSRQCAERANKQRLRDWSRGIVQSKNDLEVKESARIVMTPAQLAIYLGVCRRTVYNYIVAGKIKALQIQGKTLIRKSDVDKMFDEAPPYHKKTILHEEKAVPSSPSGKPSTTYDYTTAKEVAERYHLSPAGADKLLKKSGITLVAHRGKHYYPLSEVEALFRKREAANHPEITEWYTQKDIEEKYGLKPATIWDIVSTSKIPSKREHGKAYYSKVHFDALRGQGSEEELFYSVKQAMEKYGQTRDQVYSVLRYNNIERVLTGREVRFRRKDYDECMKYFVRSKDIHH